MFSWWHAVSVILVQSAKVGGNGFGNVGHAVEMQRLVFHGCGDGMDRIFIYVASLQPAASRSILDSATYLRDSNPSHSPNKNQEAVIPSHST